MRALLALLLALVAGVCLLGLLATLEPLTSPWPWRALYGGGLVLALVALAGLLRTGPGRP